MEKSESLKDEISPEELKKFKELIKGHKNLLFAIGNL